MHIHVAFHARRDILGTMAKVTPTPNGPYKVEGASLVDAEGEPMEAGDPMMLCRCGQSGNKPFCDGTHSKVGFEG